MSHVYAVGLDLGGTNIKAALVRDDAAMVARASRRTRHEWGAEALLADMAELANGVIADAGVARSAVIGLGIGSPGPLSVSRGVIHESVNLPCVRDLPIRAELADRLGLPAVLENDANAAACGEFWIGAGREVRDMVLLTLGTGVGGGVIMGGRLLRGRFENAGELGHLIVEAGGRTCSCGQRGCLEQYASAGSVARRAIERLQAGQKSTLQDHADGIGSITARDVAEAARQGDRLATDVWEETCRYLAIGCVSIQRAFDPARIVLGGGMSAAGPLLFELVRVQCEALDWRLTKDRADLVPAELGNNAGMIGAAGLALARQGRLDLEPGTSD